ncbi:MAG: NAD(+)/NADH kinase [Acidimicrobiia bacterium]
MKLALVVHPSRPKAVDVATRLVEEADRRGVAVTASEADASRVAGTTRRPRAEAGDADAVIAVGGDGTVLEAVRVALHADLPVLAINAGHVGFLAEIEPDRISEALDLLLAGQYTESNRMTLAAHLPGREPVDGINDVVVEKVVSQHVVRIAVAVGGEHFANYRPDALIVASPTGSTAYTFSAGGPLIDPELKAVALTAVAPHDLFARPIVFRPDVTLRLTVVDSRPVRVNVDGRPIDTLDEGEWIEVTKGSRPARFISFWPRNFAGVVKEKFQLRDR